MAFREGALRKLAVNLRSFK